MGFRVDGVGCAPQLLGWRVWASGPRMGLGFEDKGQGFRLDGLGGRVESGLRFKDLGLGFGVQGSGFGV